MAACGAMSLSKGILAAALVGLLVAGCSKMVDGQPLAAVPPPGAKLVILPGVSHFAMLQDPAEFNQAIRDFLEAK